MKWLFVLLIFCSAANIQEVVRTVEAHKLIGDPGSAVKVAREGVRQFGDLPEARGALIRALSAAEEDKRTVKLLQEYEQAFGPSEELREAVCWGVMRKGAHSSGLMPKVASLLGATLTRDVYAVDLVVEALRSKRPAMRGLGVEMASMLRDRRLCEEIARLVYEEKNRQVRLEAISAAGKLQLKELAGPLRMVVASPRATAEETWAATQAVVALTDAVERQDLERLTQHKRAAVRLLACELVAQRGLVEDVDLIKPLLQDCRPDVRQGALSCLGILRCATADEVSPLLGDREPTVAITAAWHMTLIDADKGMQSLQHWLGVKQIEQVRLAAGALARTGRHGIPLSRQIVDRHEDPYVRATLAIHLMGQRVHTKKHAEVLYEVFCEESGRWMWNTTGNSLFRRLGPSTVRHSDRVANQPEIVNQLTRLEVLSMLAVVDHPRAEDALKGFLGERSWGITGTASITLLEEGDEACLELIRHLLSDPDRNVRVQAALGLAIWGKDPSAVHVLEEAYGDADRDMKIKILEALAHIGSRDALPFLIKTLEEPFPTLRILAASAVVQCINH